MGRARSLGHGETRAYVIANLLFFLLIVITGLSYPDPKASSAPWYLNVGFIAGIPAVPRIMRYLFGVHMPQRHRRNRGYGGGATGGPQRR